MSSPNCYSSIQLCRMRVAELNPIGVPEPGTGNLAVSEAIVNLGLSWRVREGDRFELVNGCGNICATFEDCDRITGVGLTMSLCELDIELIQLLTGAEAITVGGVMVGFEVPDSNAACPNGVSLEAWSKAWDVDEQSVGGNDNLEHWRFGFPKTRWRLGDWTLANGALDVTLVGKGSKNSNFYDGPANDWPRAISNLMALFLDDTLLPASLCGVSTLVGS